MGTLFRQTVMRTSMVALASAALLWLLLARALPAQAAGVVTNCSNDVQLRSMLSTGGAVSFNCNGNNSPATIVVSPAIVVNTGVTTLDGGNKVTLSGANKNRIFIVDAGFSGPPLSFSLAHIVLTNGYAGTEPGGCMLINWSATVVLDDVTVQNCRAEGAGQGGGIYNAFGFLTISSSRVLTNAAASGGGIWSLNPITLANSLVANNRAITGTGDGLDLPLTVAVITGSTIYSNSANVGGGGINSGVSLNISNSRIENNRAWLQGVASGKTQGAGIRSLGNLAVTNTLIVNNFEQVGPNGSVGGGIYHETGRLTLTGVTIQGNRAIHGAGIYMSSGSARLSGLTFSGNLAESGDGGGLNVYGGEALVSGTTFSGNYAVFDGGAISNRGTLTVTQSALSGNGAYIGGGGIENYGTATIFSSTVANNNASGGGVGHGGGIRNSGGTLTLNGVAVQDNTANYDGGGIANGGTLYINSSTVSNNTSNGGDEVDDPVHGGGGIYNGGALYINNSTVSGNKLLQRDGGGIYNGNYVSLNSSTVSGNQTLKRDGGGMYNGYTAIADALNTTFSGNIAKGWGGAILSNHAQTTLVHVTLSGNSAAAGGGIYNLTVFPTRTVLLQNSILANNPAPGYNCAQFPGSLDVVSYGYNLSDDDSFNTFCPIQYQPGDISNADDRLGPLANNGGATLTHLPLPGSAAIDKIPQGTNHCAQMYPTDQRGRPRPVNGDADPTVKCDIGAVEVARGELTPWLYLPLIRR